MKNLPKLLFSLLFLSFISISCEKDEDEELKNSTDSIVEITVKSVDGKIKSNVTVYMFTDPATETFGHSTIYAKKESVSDENGIARFELKETIDLDPIDSQTTLYFTSLTKISEMSYSVDGTIGVTVKKGENISKTLNLNK